MHTYRCPTRLVGMGQVKVTEETVIQDITLGNPWLLLRTVPLPVDQELETASTPMDVKNKSNCVGGTTSTTKEGG